MRFYKYIEETTVTGDVAKNLAKGHVDVIGAPKYKKKKKKTRLDRRPIVVHETSVSSAVVGSQQTRVVGDDHDITVLKRQPRPLKFMERVGAYLPPDEEEEIEEAAKCRHDFRKDAKGDGFTCHLCGQKAKMMMKRGKKTIVPIEEAHHDKKKKKKKKKKGLPVGTSY